MTMFQLSQMYRENARQIHQRLQLLREQLRQTEDQEQAQALRRRINDLLPLWREARDLSRLTEHYYDRSYNRDERYTC